MLQAIREILPLALGVAISPIPMAAVIFVLMTKKGRTNAWAFLLGWIIGLVLLVGGVASLIGALEKTGGNNPGWTLPAIRIGFGIVMLHLSARSWLRRPRPGEEPGTPRWMETLDQLDFLKSMLVGIGFLTLNLKNFPIAVSAGAVLSRHQSMPGQSASALLVFTLVSGIGVASPVVVACLGGQRTTDVLQTWKNWLGAHNAVIICGLFLVIGLTSLSKGLEFFL